MIKVAKQLINLKSLIVFIIIQIAIAILFANTVLGYFNTLAFENQFKESNIDLKQVVFFSDLTQEEYTIIYSELSEKTSIYNYQLTVIGSSDSNTNTQIVFDDNLAKVLSDLGYIKIIDKSKSDLTNKKSSSTYGTCKEILFREELYSCTEDLLSVNSNLYTELMNDAYVEYSDIFTTNTLIEYDGDLALLISEIAKNNGFEAVIEVYDNNKNSIISKDIMLSNTKMQKQNIIAVVTTSCLLIVLTVLYFMIRNLKKISILMLLGYSRLKIVSIILSVYLISLTIPCLILFSKDSLVILEYFLFNMIIGMISVILILYAMNNTFKDKAREKM